MNHPPASPLVMSAALLGALAALSAPALSALPTAPEPGTAPTPRGHPDAVEFFERSVRPLLVEQCFPCHGPRVQQAGLRLDSRTALLKGGARGPSVSGVEPARSLLLRAISYQEPGLHMPPRGKLPAEKIELLTRWVREGAVFPAAAPASPAGLAAVTARTAAARTHWAFQPLRRPALPRVRRGGWVRTPVDAFVLAGLEASGLAPAPEADPRTLIRRVSFDVTGLPPSPAEVEAFVRECEAEPARAGRGAAYARVVDRLLASPHYGERWARHWLDLVRYAETDGHEFDFDKPGAFEYRDYVIRALNADVPYDQFVREHVAGDLLPRPRRNPVDGSIESLIGTGFFWLGEGKHSPVDLMEDEAEREDNQIDVLSRAFLGLSLGCARCHDHKFDPISTRDFYALAGHLRSSRFQLAAVEAPEPGERAAAELERLRPRLDAALAQHALTSRLPELERLAEYLIAARQPEGSVETPGLDRETLARWRKHLAETAGRTPGDPLRLWGPDAGRTPRRRPAAARPAKTAVFEEFAGPGYGDWSAAGPAFGRGPATAPAVRCDLSSPGRVDALLDAGTADSGAAAERLSGALRSRTFGIERPFIHYRMAGRASQVNLIIDGFQRIRNPLYGGLTVELKDGRAGWYTQNVGKWIGHRAYIELQDHGPGWIAVDQIVFGDGPPPAAASDPELDPSAGDAASAAQVFQERVLEAVRAGLAGRGEPAQRELAAWALRTVPPAGGPLPPDLAAALAARERLEGAIPLPRRVMAMTDGTGENHPVYLRGSPRSPGPEVPRRFLTLLAGERQPPPASGSGRLELAEKMIAAPLLARVMVNRVWRHHFGEGIVRTPDDFGTRGEPPSHPELLKYLARGFSTGSYGPAAGEAGPPGPQPWSLKALHRAILLSATYRMASRGDARAERADPQNRLIHRAHVRRLEAEAIRDAVLAVSGRLDRTLYGPSLLPHLTTFMEGRGRPASSGPLDGGGRRSLYIGVRRNFLTPLFLAFDFPIPFTTMGRRSVSTVPAQALTLMNNPFVVEQAGVWARRVLAAEVPDTGARLRRMYLEAFARPAGDEELRAATAFLAEQDRAYGTPGDPRSWGDLAHVLLNAKEFIFIR